MVSCSCSLATAAVAVFAISGATHAFAPHHAAITSAVPPSRSATSSTTTTTSQLYALDDKMMERLEGIRRSYNALTERLADPDVIGDTNLLRQVMSDRSKSEEVVLAFEEVRRPLTSRTHYSCFFFVECHLFTFIDLLDLSYRLI